MSSPMYDDDGHCPIPVDTAGNGPLDDSDPLVDRLMCLCSMDMPWPCPAERAEADAEHAARGFAQR